MLQNPTYVFVGGTNVAQRLLKEAPGPVAGYPMTSRGGPLRWDALPKIQHAPFQGNRRVVYFAEGNGKYLLKAELI